MTEHLIGHRADYIPPTMSDGMMLPGYVHISAIRPGFGRVLIAAYNNVRTRKNAATFAALHGLDLEVVR